MAAETPAAPLEKAADLAAIIEQVVAIVPEYRFEVHHHSQDIVDTILYGACP